MSDPMTDRAAAEAFTGKWCHRPNPNSAALYGYRQDQLHHNGKHYCWASGTYQRWGSQRCAIAARTELANGSWWCHIHEPASVAKRAAEMAARGAANSARLAAMAKTATYRKALEDNYPKLVAALREIEAGHNDPRSLARDTLAMLPEGDEGG